MDLVSAARAVESSLSNVLKTFKRLSEVRTFSVDQLIMNVLLVNSSEFDNLLLTELTRQTRTI